MKNEYLNDLVRALGSTNQALLGLATSIAQQGQMIPTAWIEQDLNNWRCLWLD